MPSSSRPGRSPTNSPATCGRARPPLVVGEGVSGALDLPADAAARAAALDLPEQPYLVTLATIEPRKGLDVLLDALALPAAPDGPAAGGRPARLGRGRRGAGGPAELGIGDRVRLLGRLPDADLAVVLTRAAALVAPSRAEGFGLPVLEAMAAGVPVVSSDAPALVEVGGGATVTVPVGDSAALADALAEVLRLGGPAGAARRRRPTTRRPTSAGRPRPAGSGRSTRS